MKTILSKFEIEEWVGIIGLSVMGTITFANVLARYVFMASWAFSEELVTGLFLLITLLGAAIGARQGSLIGLSMLTDFIPQKYQKYVNVFQSVCILAFSSLLVVYGAQMAKSEWDMGITTAALGIPEAVYGSFVPIGGLFLVINSIRNIVSNLRATTDEKVE